MPTKCRALTRLFFTRAKVTRPGAGKPPGRRFGREMDRVFDPIVEDKIDWRPVERAHDGIKLETFERVVVKAAKEYGIDLARKSAEIYRRFHYPDPWPSEQALDKVLEKAEKAADSLARSGMTNVQCPMTNEVAAARRRKVFMEIRRAWRRFRNPGRRPGLQRRACAGGARRRRA